MNTSPQPTESKSARTILEKLYIPFALIALLVPGLRRISHSDFWSHLAIGRWIATHGIPRTDPFGLATEGHAWMDSSWLYDRMLYLLWNAGGAGLITLVHVLAVLAAFALLIQTARRKTGPMAIALALFLSAWLLAPRFEIRAAVFCLLFSATFIHVLSREPAPTPWKLFALLLPIQIGWTNMHTSFLWGPFITILFIVQSRYQGPTRSGANTRILLYLLIALFGATLINPYGFGVYRAVIASWSNPLVLQDWISPYSGHFQSALSKHMVTLALIIGAGGLLTQKQRLPIALTATAVVSAFLVVRSIGHHLETFALLAFPFFTLSLSAIGQYGSERLSTLYARYGKVTRWIAPGAVTLLAVLSVGSVVTNRYYISTGSLSSFGLGAATQGYPALAADVIADPAFPVAALNLPIDGGYLAWAHPERKVWIDQRTELYSMQAYHDLGAGLAGQTQEWEAVTADLKPQAIVLNTAWPQASEAIRHLQLHERWETIYFDGTTIILVENVSAQKELLRKREALLAMGLAHIEADRKAYRDALEHSIFRPAVPARLIGAAAIFQQRGRHREAAALYELLTLGAPGMVTAWLNLGINLNSMGDYASAQTALRKALQHLPRDSAPWTMTQLNMGISQIGLERYNEGLRHLNLVVDIMPNNPLVWMWIYRAHLGAGRTADAQTALVRAQKINPQYVELFLRAGPPQKNK